MKLLTTCSVGILLCLSGCHTKLRSQRKPYTSAAMPDSNMSHGMIFYEKDFENYSLPDSLGGIALSGTIDFAILLENGAPRKAVINTGIIKDAAGRIHYKLKAGHKIQSTYCDYEKKLTAFLLSLMSKPEYRKHIDEAATTTRLSTTIKFNTGK